MELMFEPLFKYATFAGRARRKEYWLFILFITVVGLVASGIDALLGFVEVGPVNLIWTLAVLLPVTGRGGSASARYRQERMVAAPVPRSVDRLDRADRVLLPQRRVGHEPVWPGSPGSARAARRA